MMSHRCSRKPVHIAAPSTTQSFSEIADNRVKSARVALNRYSPWTRRVGAVAEIFRTKRQTSPARLCQVDLNPRDRLDLKDAKALVDRAGALSRRVDSGSSPRRPAHCQT